jgi:hypothetical protein
MVFKILNIIDIYLLVSISAGLVLEPALCPGAGAAERSQETL